MGRIFMTLPSIFISWISAIPAAVELTPTRRVSSLAVRVMKAPLDFCCGTVARAQASAIVTSACATVAASDRNRAVRLVAAMRADGVNARVLVCMDSLVWMSIRAPADAGAAMDRRHVRRYRLQASAGGPRASTNCLPAGWPGAVVAADWTRATMAGSAGLAGTDGPDRTSAWPTAGQQQSPK